MCDTSVVLRPYHTPEPFSRPTSSIVVIPTLEPIPQSAVPTPAARDSPGPETQAARDEEGDIATALQDISLSRNSSVRSHVQGSYFSAVPIASSSGNTTPGGRPRPAIEIPCSTPDQPLFSSYPNQAETEADNVRTGETKTTLRPVIPSAIPFPSSRLRIRRKHPVTSEGEDSAASDESTGTSGSRRRSGSFLLKQPKPTVKGRPNKSVLGRRRAGSLGARLASEYHEGDDEAWRRMAGAELDRMHPEPSEPFVYKESGSDLIAVEAPAAPPADQSLGSPPISPRRSSLVAADGPFEIPEGRVIDIPEDLVKPHEPPPRRSSLDLTSISALSTITKEDLPSTHQPIEAQSAISSSVLSSSVTYSDPSIFSPTSSSQEHPLSSATTSLSRSAKSAKEGTDERDTALSAVKLQRSLEWEAKQNKRRRRLDKRKMVLLELVETEVAYAEALRGLVHVYLPQLAALPSVSERTATLIARNAAELLEFHANLATRMVEILKAERIAYDILHDPDVPVERAARRIAALFIEHVSTHMSGHSTDG